MGLGFFGIGCFLIGAITVTSYRGVWLVASALASALALVGMVCKRGVRASVLVALG